MSQQRILVVEDDSLIREGLACVLHDEGYGVATANNGKAALLHLQSAAAPHLILLDIIMPVMTGWELRARLLNDNRYAEIPIIVVSATAEYEKARDLLSPAACVRKPIDLRQLFNQISQVLAS